jgi:hypothetical protein
MDGRLFTRGAAGDFRTAGGVMEQANWVIMAGVGFFKEADGSTV